MVYVDTLLEWGPTEKWPYKYACHMMADTEEELHAFALKIGLKRKWFQSSPPHRIPHYDITEAMRKKAIKAGAISSEQNHDAVDDCMRWWFAIARKWNKEVLKAKKIDVGWEDAFLNPE